MNKTLKVTITIVSILIIFIILVQLSFAGLNVVSIDKKIYSSGENITGHITHFSMMDCVCSDGNVNVYKQDGLRWKIVEDKLEGFGDACVDGILTSLGECDYNQCQFHISAGKRAFTWSPKIYEYNDSVVSCYSPNRNITINKTGYYTSSTASPGIYKFVYARSEKIIEIR